MSTKVGPNGQVVIHKHIRERLGIEPGALAIQRIVGDELVIGFVPPRHERSLRGMLANARRRSVNAESWPQAMADAWRQSAADSSSPHR
jgi:AbrB family looped-hinge helix DNA binding protein